MSATTHTTHRSRLRLPAVLAMLFIGLAYPLLRLIVAEIWPPAKTQLLFTDDAFYYQVIAENLASGAGSTFGGLVRTNGYQPLWQAILAGLATIASGNALLLLTHAVEAILFSTTILFAWMITRRLGAIPAGPYATTYTVVIGLLAGQLFFSGMELAIVLPLALAFILAVLSSRNGVLLGLIALGLALGRLDALSFPVAYGAVSLLHRPSRANLQKGTLTATVAISGLAAYAAVNQTLFNTPVPISGQAKALGGGSFDFSLVAQYLSFGTIGPIRLYLGVQVVVITAAAALLLRHSRRTDRMLFAGNGDRMMARLLTAASIGQIVQLGYYTVTSSWQMWSWYFYYVPIQLLLGTLVVAQAVSRDWGLARSPYSTIATAAAAMAVLMNAFLSMRPPPWQAATPFVADWIVAHTSTRETIGIGDRAGYLTWLTRRPTLQLEGLVEDPEYLRDVASHRIDQAVTQRSITLYVRSEDLTRFTEPTPDSNNCREYVEPRQGGGPKSTIKACDAQLLYSTGSNSYEWRIYRTAS